MESLTRNRYAHDGKLNVQIRVFIMKYNYLLNSEYHQFSSQGIVMANECEESIPLIQLYTCLTSCYNGYIYSAFFLQELDDMFNSSNPAPPAPAPAPPSQPALLDKDETRKPGMLCNTRQRVSINHQITLQNSYKPSFTIFQQQIDL